MRAYTLKKLSADRWAIYAPGQEDKKPVVMIECDPETASRVVVSLSMGDGLPDGLGRDYKVLGE
jgi:hypothetical protein